MDFTFRNTNLSRLHLKTLEWNERARKCFLKAGFTPCGSLHRAGHNFILMEIYRWHWEEARKLGGVFGKIRRAAKPNSPPENGEAD